MKPDRPHMTARVVPLSSDEASEARVAGTAEERLALVARYSTGFIYLVSRTGVTGEQDTVSDAVGPLVAATRKLTSLPLAVGFGIAKAQDAAVVGAIAEAVVVGSAFVRLIENNAASPDLDAKLEALARELKQGAVSARKKS